MFILYKYIIKEMLNKKVRTIMIVLSICISSAMFFASQTLSKSLVKIQEESYKTSVGTADIVICNNDGNGMYFNEHYFDKCGYEYDYIIGSSEAKASYFDDDKNANIPFSLKGMALEDIGVMNPIAFLSRENADFSGRKIIIGKYTSDKYKIITGDVIAININGEDVLFDVYGISSLSGFFANDGQSYLGIIPQNTLNEILGLDEGYVSTLYLRLESSVHTDSVIGALSSENGTLSVTESYSKSKVETESKSLTTQMYILLIIISTMSFYIIYSSFKVLIMERLPVIGTFRSVGASKKQTSLLLITEGLVYGISGGIFGCGLGVLILNVMANLSTPADMKGTGIYLVFTLFDLIAAFSWAIFLSAVSVILPSVKVGRISIKSIILNLHDKTAVKKYDSLLRFFIGIALLAVSIISLYLVPENIAVIVDSIVLIIMIYALFILTPFLVSAVTFIMEKVYLRIFGYIGTVALKNIRNNRANMSNILLLELAIATIISVFTVTGSIVDEIDNTTVASYLFDIRVKAFHADNEFMKSLDEIEGVEDVYGIYYQPDVFIDLKNDKIGAIEGVNIDYLNFRQFNYNGSDIEKKQILNKLQDGKYILMTYMLMDKFDFNDGDIVVLTTDNKKVEYIIAGSFYSLLERGGDYAIISDENFKEDFEDIYYSEVYVKTAIEKDVGKIENMIIEKYNSQNIWTRTMEEQIILNDKNSTQKTNIFRGLAIVVFIISFFGIFNNLIMNFLERKKGKSIMRSVGMSKKQGIYLIFIESITSGFIGGLMGLFGASLIIFLSKFIMSAINKVYPLTVSPKLFISFFLIAVACNVIAFVALELITPDNNIAEEIIKCGT